MSEPEQLGKAKHELVEQFRGGVFLSVPGRIEGGVVEPEVGAEVEDVSGVQLGHDWLARPRGGGR